MRFGIYLGKTDPTLGGAHTLTETVRREIASSSCAHDRIVFFDDESSEQEFELEGIRYVNLAEKHSPGFGQRVFRKGPS